MIAVRTRPLSERQYAALKAANKIKHMPTSQEIAADTQRAVERDREKAVRQAETLLAEARRAF